VIPLTGRHAAIVLSVETTRATGGPTALELRAGADGSVLETVDGASLVVAEDAPLPPSVAFMARRRGATHLPGAGGSWSVAIRRWRRGRVADVATWGASGGPVRLVEGDAVRVDPLPGGVLVGRADGSIEPIGDGGGRGARLAAHGRRATPLLRGLPTGPELVVDLASGRVVGGRVRGRGFLVGRWRIAGHRTALLQDTAGVESVVVGTGEPGRHALATWTGTRPGSGSARHTALDAPLDQPPTPLPGGGVALTLRTGVHTLATEVRDAAGALVARLPAGAYLHPAAVLEAAGGWLLVLDDREAWRCTWVAAYSVPIAGPFGPGGRPLLVRAGGTHGV
jgi:hypothetical protein